MMANIVMLGFLAAVYDLISAEALRKAVLTSVPEPTREIMHRPSNAAANTVRLLSRAGQNRAGCKGLVMHRSSSSSNLKKAVLLVGSGYGALKVAQDLSQSGLPLVWVTKAIHFLEHPGGAEPFTDYPEDLDFQFRPLYLQVTRHPLVTALTHARVEAIKRGPDGYRAVITQDPVYVDYDLCTGCGRCMEICPLQDSSHPPLRRTPAYCPSRALDLDKRKPLSLQDKLSPGRERSGIYGADCSLAIRRGP